MRDFIASAFEVVLTIIFWVDLVVGIVIGCIVGNRLGHPYVGFFCGLILTFLYDVVVLGFLFQIADMRETANNSAALLEDIKRTLTDIKNKNNVSGAPVQTPFIEAEVNGESWTCRTCGTRNPLTAHTCSGCGAYH